ncbi:MAG: ribonuclease III [Clostridia bacterium]|nr:ribonuclease III [Clostridia bacterium]
MKEKREETGRQNEEGEIRKAVTSRVEKSIGYEFYDKMLLHEALTHSSYSYEHGGQKVCPCNERLEFLGDSVLSVIVSEYLFENYPDSPEGDLTRCRAELVCERALSEYATEIGLGDSLLLGKGEEKNGGRTRPSLLCDAYEALLAAVYIDSGEGDAGKTAVAEYVMPSVMKRLGGMMTGKPVIDYKTLLQETVQADSKGEHLEYVLVEEEGPDHAKIFTVEARIDSNVFGRGTGSSRKKAEQNAARQALIKCGVIESSENDEI